MKRYIPILLLAVTTLGGCSNIITSSDIEREPHYNEVEDLHIEWNDMFDQNEDQYYVYVYAIACTACSMLREGIVNFSRNSGNNFYFVYPSDDIDYVDDEETAETSLGATSIADVHIYTTPTLIKITDGAVTYYSRDYYEIKSLIEE